MNGSFLCLIGQGGNSNFDGVTDVTVTWRESFGTVTIDEGKMSLLPPQ